MPKMFFVSTPRALFRAPILFLVFSSLALPPFLFLVGPANAQIDPSTQDASAEDLEPILAETPRVLLVGDSWSFYMFLDGTINRMFDRHGFGDFGVVGARTARSGSKAKHWVEPDYLARIDEELVAWPSIDMVQVTMTGNDFLAGKSSNGWYAGMSQQAEDQLAAKVLSDLEVVLDHIHLVAPEVEILVSLYDHPNFVETLNGLAGPLCFDLWNDLNMPTPEELNLAAERFYNLVESRIRGRAKTQFVSQMGTMQFEYGYPSLAILPHTLTPTGDLRLPSPPEAMRYGGADCFHLSKASYDQLAENLWREFYGPRLSGELVSHGFEQGVFWPLSVGL